MKKLFITVLAVMLTLGTGLAEVLDPWTALERVFSDGNTPTVMKSRANTFRTASARLVHTGEADGQPAVYVFSFEGDKAAAPGFAVVAADDAVPALLGYGDAPIDTANMAPAFLYWVGDYAAQIGQIRTTSAGKRRVVPALDKPEIGPLMTTTWNQGNPYNQMCPTVGTRATYTGCVATAMAQVMKYHKWPAQNGTGTASYTWNSQTLSMNFSTTSFNWDNMLDNYVDGKYSQTEADAVALLMKACGYSVQMDYGTSASGAVTAYVADALKTYFGYSKSIYFTNRSSYYMSEWQEFIYNQLKEYGPVQFSGRNSSGGHSFVCDGFKGGLFHFNWGWGGSSDGYFQLSSLNPSEQGIGGSTAGYDQSQGVLADVRPARDGDRPYYCIYSSDPLTLSATQCAQGASVTLSNFIGSGSSADMDVYYGVRYENIATNAVTYNIALWFNPLKPGYGYSSFPIKALSSLADGTYKCTLVWQLRGDADWNDISLAKNGPQYVLMTIDNGIATFATGGMAEIETTDLAEETPFYMNTEFAVTATVNNLSDVEYSGTVLGVLFSEDGTTQIASGDDQPLYIAANGSDKLTYTSKFTAMTGRKLAPGKYRFVLADGNTMGIISNVLEVEIKAKPTTVTLNIANLASDARDEGRANPADMSFTGDISCTAGYYFGNFRLYIFPYITGQSVSSIGSISSHKISIAEGQTKKINFRGGVSAMTSGERYFTGIYDGNGNRVSGSQIVFLADNTTGIEDIVADGPATGNAAVSVYTVSGVPVGTSLDGLAPGVYIVVETAANGARKVTRHLVR